MPGAWRIASLLVLAVLVAGCTKGSDGGRDPPDPPATGSVGPTPTGSDEPRADTAGSKPLWFPGLQWTYQAEFPPRGVSGPMKVTVVTEDDVHWQLGAEAADDVLLWSLFAHLPPLGPVDKETFAVTIHNEPIAWFDFPLTDGKTWSAPDHHGTTVNYTATKSEARLPDGRTLGAYAVVGERTGTDWIRYTYTADAGWFTGVEVLFEGEVTARLTLQDAAATSDHRTTPTFEPREIAAFNDVGPTTLIEEPEPFTVTSDATDIYAYWVMGGDLGFYSGAITLPDGTTHSYNHTEVNQTPGVRVVGVRFDPEAGQGTFGSIVGGQGFVLGELFEVVRRAPAG